METAGVERQLREDIARLILDERVDCAEHPPGLPKPSCWTCARNGAFTRAARIALGGHRGPSARRSGWRSLPGRIMQRRARVEAIDHGGEAPFTEKHVDPRPAREVAVDASVTLPSGTAMTAADDEALVTRFTAHARVLIASGLCPLHETPLDPVRLDPERPQSRFFAGGCGACGRGWSLGPVTPYVLTGGGVTGGEPVRPGRS